MPEATMTTEVPRGLGFPLDCSLGTFAVSSGIAKLEQGLRLILLTYPGERVMRPDFGCRLRDFVFEPVTPATEAALAIEVRRAVGACEPRVVVERVDVSSDPVVDGLLHLSITYRPLAGDRSREFVLEFRGDRAADVVLAGGV
jgi:Bacteriophage baseplate protein W